MLLLILILASIVMVGAVKLYSGSDGRILPLSAPRGKEARIVLISILVGYLFLIGLNVFSRASNVAEIGVWVLVFLLSGAVPMWRYIQFKKGKK